MAARLHHLHFPATFFEPAAPHSIFGPFPGFQSRVSRTTKPCRQGDAQAGRCRRHLKHSQRKRADTQAPSKLLSIHFVVVALETC